MAPSPKSWLRVRPARAATSGNGSSVLRLAARGRPASGGAPHWLAGLTRALRSAGPAQGETPLHGMLAADFAPGERRGGR